MAVQSKRVKRRNLRRSLWERNDGICPLCGEPIPAEKVDDSEYANIDHIRPRSHGGSDKAWNLQLTHSLCNTLKSSDCPGCDGCAPKRKMEIWREQNYRCPRCEEAIFPSHVNDRKFTDIGMTYGGQYGSRPVRRIPGKYYLLHVGCISEEVRRIRQNEQ